MRSKPILITLGTATPKDVDKLSNCYTVIPFSIQSLELKGDALIKKLAELKVTTIAVNNQYMDAVFIPDFLTLVGLEYTILVMEYTYGKEVITKGYYKAVAKKSWGK